MNNAKHRNDTTTLALSPIAEPKSWTENSCFPDLPKEETMKRDIPSSNTILHYPHFTSTQKSVDNSIKIDKPHISDFDNFADL